MEGIDEITAQVKVDAQSLVQYQERETIRLLLNYADKSLEQQKLADFLLHELEDVEFSNDVFKEIYKQFKNGYSKGQRIDSEFFLQNGSDPVKRMVTDLVTQRYDTSKHWSEKYQIFFPKDGEELGKKALANVLHLKYRVVQKWIEENKEKIKFVNNIKEEDELMERQTELKRIDMELAEQLGIVSGKY